MSRVVHLHQLLGTHVRVALRRRQTAVAEQLLDETQVSTFSEHVCGKRVTQRVVRHATVEPRKSCMPPDDTLGAPRRESTAPMVREERAGCPASRGQVVVDGGE